MKTITFYDYGLEDVISNRKFSTIRIGEDGYNVGDFVKLERQSGHQLGWLLITRKESLSFGNLSDLDARIENWASKTELKSRLEFSYGRLAPKQKLTRYSFLYTNEISPNIVRGKNEQFKNTKSKTILISTENATKAKRYKQIFSELDTSTSFVAKKLYKEENINQFSSEHRAIGKIINSVTSADICFATDDMASICLKNQVLHIPNLNSFNLHELPIKRTIPFTIRTGMAIRFKTKINHTVVYRSFFFYKGTEKQKYHKLNDHLYLDRMTSREFCYHLQC